MGEGEGEMSEQSRQRGARTAAWEWWRGGGQWWSVVGGQRMVGDDEWAEGKWEQKHEKVGRWGMPTDAG